LRRKSNGGIYVLTFFVALIVGVVYLYNSAMFEQNPPTAKIQEQTEFWNLKTPLHLQIADDTGLKRYRVLIQTSHGEKELASANFITPTPKVELELKAPAGVYVRKEKTVKIIVEAQDISKWNFFKGNTSQKVFEYVVDRKRPRVSVIANSYKIVKGGAALVVFKATDENLKDVYIKTSFGKVFHPTPFYKEGYYISLLAWPIKANHFRAEVVATDMAGNKVKSYIPLYLKNKQYRVSRIKLSDKFLKGKIYDLASEFEETDGVEDKLEQFKIINEDVRAKNEELIHQLSSKVPTEMVYDFSIHKMYPLKNAAPVASFGDHRIYYYNGRKISEAYHMGLDLASVAMADIKTQNSGEVVFADFNGLYGNMPLIHHGLGLYTLYGHCSSLMVSKGDEVTPGEVIAKSGKSGYAMGDHLHFGVLVQGIEVRPAEWMDRKWIKLNITDVIKLSKKMIDKE